MTKAEEGIVQLKMALTETNGGLRGVTETATRANDRSQSHESKIVALETTIASLKEQIATQRTVAMWAAGIFASIYIALFGAGVAITLNVIGKLPSPGQKSEPASSGQKSD